jgi:hypothetical protein
LTPAARCCHPAVARPVLGRDRHPGASATRAQAPPGRKRHPGPSATRAQAPPRRKRHPGASASGYVCGQSLSLSLCAVKCSRTRSAHVLLRPQGRSGRERSRGRLRALGGGRGRWARVVGAAGGWLGRLVRSICGQAFPAAWSRPRPPISHPAPASPSPAQPQPGTGTGTMAHSIRPEAVQRRHRTGYLTRAPATSRPPTNHPAPPPRPSPTPQNPAGPRPPRYLQQDSSPQACPVSQHLQRGRAPLNTEHLAGRPSLPHSTHHHSRRNRTATALISKPAAAQPRPATRPGTPKTREPPQIAASTRRGPCHHSRPDQSPGDHDTASTPAA